MPTVGCLTDPEHGCLCCLDSQRDGVDGAGGRRNRRRNTSAAIRVRDPADSELVSCDLERHRVRSRRRPRLRCIVRPRISSRRQRTIVIDAGKSFYAAATEWFPKHGLRRIDALLLTHAHADAAMLDVRSPPALHI